MLCILGSLLKVKVQNGGNFLGLLKFQIFFGGCLKFQIFSGANARPEPTYVQKMRVPPPPWDCSMKMIFHGPNVPTNNVRGEIVLLLNKMLPEAVQG